MAKTRKRSKRNPEEPKKTVSARVDEETESWIERLAKERNWTVSKLVGQLLVKAKTLGLKPDEE